MLDELWVLLFWAGQVLFALGYVLKDVRWLRRLTLLGCLVVTPYYLIRGEPLWSPIIWTGVYFGINGVHLFSLWRSAPRPPTAEAVRPRAIDVA